MPGPAFLAELGALKAEKRQAALDRKHPAYDEHIGAWRVLLDAYDGSGGFLDGAHLWRYPRETDAAFVARREQARYHNYGQTLVDLYARKIFAQTINRDTTDAGLIAWWTDVDGRGTDIDTYQRDSLALSLTLGHVGTLVDKTPDAPTGPAVTDERARVVLARYLPASIWDWRTDGEDLRLVKLREAVEPTTLVMDDAADDYRLLIWAVDGWARITPAGDVRDQSEDGWALGGVPLVLLRPARSHRWPFLGKSLLNAGILRALYNRASEEDEVLRSQAFSVLTVQIPPDADMAAAKQEMGGEIGTTRALFTRGPASFITPDMAASQAIRDNQTYLVQELYRMAHLRFERQSLDAQSGEAIRLQFDELNESLAGIAAECARAEIEIARWYFRWTTPTPEQAERAFEAAAVQVSYPREFFTGDLETDLAAWAQAASLALGATAQAELKKRAVARLLPDLDDATLDTIRQEIDAAKSQASSLSGAAGGLASIGAALRENALRRMGQVAGETPMGGSMTGQGEGEAA